MKRTGLLLLALAVVAATSTVGMAQVRQLQTGRAMDANPQVGGGGSNAPVTGYVPVNGNEVLTGNVTGLGYFHGTQTFVPGVGVYRSNIGTFSPYQFNGNLGSSSLSNFARQSAGNYGGNTGGAQAYYLPSGTVSTGQGALYSAPVGAGFDSAIVPRSSISPMATDAQIGSLNQNSYSLSTQYQAINRLPSNLPQDVNAPGSLLASPLFVLRTTELPTTRPGDARALKANAATQPGDQDGTDLEKQNPALITGVVAAVRDSRRLGQNDQVKNAQVSDNFAKLASELQSLSGPQAGDGQNPDKPGFGAPGGIENTTGQEIDPFTGKPRQIATLSGASRGGPQKPQEPAKPGEPSRGGDAAGLSAKRLTTASTNQLTAGGKVKPVRLAPEVISPGASVSGYDMTMARAEQFLKAGKYLDAAETFQAALGLKPEDPLALVGRAHAEFGAGLYSSASHDLKFVFIRKPELVSVRYDVSSFIPAARQEFLMEDLQKLTTKKESSDMASFLYAYLCYQTGRTTAMQSEIKAWGERPNHDEWQFVLNRAWVRLVRDEAK